MSALRNRMEGLDFWLHNRKAYPHLGDYGRRRRREGLRAFREAWWIQSRLERYGTLRRYAFQLDWAVARGAVPERDGILPPGARVLVVRMGHIGDVLHLMPTLIAMRRQRPDLCIEMITGPWNEALVSRYDCLNAVHYFTPDVMQFHRGDRSRVRDVLDERSFMEGLRGEGVDLVFCPAIPHFSVLPLIVAWGPGKYVGGEWPLPVLQPRFECATRPFESRRYELDFVGDYLPLMGLDRPELKLEYPVSQQARSRIADAIQERHGEASDRSSRIVLLFPGSGWPGKNWPIRSFAELADWIVRELNMNVGLAGAPNERQLCEQVRAMMKQPACVWAGDLTLDESAALIERAVAVIGNDSAPVHIAAALGVATVSLWGPTFSEKWAPRGVSHLSVSARHCAGCVYWHPRARCQGQPVCMTTISVEEVKDAVRRLLVR